MIRLTCVLATIVLLHWQTANFAAAQLRIVTYNTNTFGTEIGSSSVRNIRPEADVVFEAIGQERVRGIQRPADIILLQEQQRPQTTTQNLVERLNNIYAAEGITYARGSVVADTAQGSGNGPLSRGEIRQSVVYRTDSVSLVNELAFGDRSGSVSQPRETLLHRFRPVGYGSDSDLYVFNAHYKASNDPDDLADREAESRAIRNYIDRNGLQNANVIVGGDLNVNSTFETSGFSGNNGRSAFEILTDPGPGRVLDPVFPGAESVNFEIYSPGVPNTQFGVDLAPLLTQSPSGGGGALVGGGIDDRFDFLLQSDELLDNEGVASIDGTLRSFGNNGSTPNTRINNGNTIQIEGLTTFTTDQVLDALESASDHLPVVMDFQLPAILDAFLLTGIPTDVMQGDMANVGVGIENSADVLVSIGADELDFDLSTSGDLFGSVSGSELALGGIFSTLVTLDTSEVGLRQGLISVTTTSPGSPINRIDLPIQFNVVTAVPEPATTIVLLGLGTYALGRRRRQ